MDKLFGLLTLLSDHWLVVVTVPLLVSFSLFYWHILGDREKPGDRHKIARFLDEQLAPSFYRALLKAVLDRLSDRLERPNAEDQPLDPKAGWFKRLDWYTDMRSRDRETAKAEATDPFGWPLFDKCLLFAFLYPVFSLFLLWAMTGIEGRIGNLPVLPAMEGWRWERFVTICGIALMIYPGMLSSNSRWRNLGWTVAIGSLFAVAGAVAVAFAVAGAVAVGRMSVNGRGLRGYAGLVAVTLVAGAFATWLMPGRARDAQTLVVFLVLLPVINGVFDFLSVGVTRLLLRKGQGSGFAALLGLCGILC
ncbi:MAG: hypothetical protein KDH19_18000, partial [Geminicoccaceae bacterium]|nr:hypothetical protein [Geminicoccaceae bacterium]